MRIKVTPNLSPDHPTGTFLRAGFRFVQKQVQELEVSENQLKALQNEAFLNVEVLPEEVAETPEEKPAKQEKAKKK